MSGPLLLGVAERPDGTFTVVLALAGEAIELADDKARALAAALQTAVDDCVRRRAGHELANGDPIRWGVHDD